MQKSISISEWLQRLLPIASLRIEEEAWNAYPYTKTRYTCPLIEKFLIDIETRYFNDDGQRENVFNLSEPESTLRCIGNTVPSLLSPSLEPFSQISSTW